MRAVEIGRGRHENSPHYSVTADSLSPHEQPESRSTEADSHPYLTEPSLSTHDRKGTGNREGKQEEESGHPIHEPHLPREADADQPVDKFCRGCDRTLVAAAFDRSSRDGLQSRCRDCKRAYNLANREAIQQREHDAYERRRAAAGKTPTVRLPARPYLERKYGLTEDAYCRLVVNQRGFCAICHQEPTERGLVVDHDHETGAVRGLLCDRCNRALGGLRDDPELVERALLYLESPPSQVMDGDA